jgi:hypothetical protein
MPEESASPSHLPAWPVPARVDISCGKIRHLELVVVAVCHVDGPIPVKGAEGMLEPGPGEGAVYIAEFKEPSSYGSGDDSGQDK